MPDVRIENVTKRFGKLVAVDDVSLHVQDKEYFALLGPSGCGKTTLLRLVAGLIEPDEGDIFIGERRVNDVPPEDRDIGFVFQTFALFPHMNAWNNVIYGPRVKGFDMDKAGTIGHEVLEMVRLHERLDAFPNELSGGMMQRIAVARALAAVGKQCLPFRALKPVTVFVPGEMPDGPGTDAVHRAKIDRVASLSETPCARAAIRCRVNRNWSTSGCAMSIPPAWGHSQKNLCSH